jgi:hypothetical protein
MQRMLLLYCQHPLGHCPLQVKVKVTIVHLHTLASRPACDEGRFQAVTVCAAAHSFDFHSKKDIKVSN